MVRHKVWISLIFIVAAAASCGQLPRPFMKDPSSDSSRLSLREPPPAVAINAIHGATVPMSNLLSASLTKELMALEMIAYSGDKGASSHVLDGWLKRSHDIGAADNRPSHIIWALTRRSGELVRTFEYKIPGTPEDWEYGSPDLIRRIGTDLAPLIVGELVSPAEKMEQAANLLKGVWIRPIVGAPGDGNVSLTSAIRFALVDVGVGLAKSEDAAAYALEAQVRIDPPVKRNQEVQFRWIVSDSEGRELGVATQNNRVATGTFDGRWGQTAVMIASAAAGSLRDIIATDRQQRPAQGAEPSASNKDEPKMREVQALPGPNLTVDPGQVE